jgi:hypothetical protein
MDWEERLAAERRERERLAKQFEETRLSAEQQREQAELAKLESQFHPVFDKFRLAGKLGDPEAEAMLDETLWLQGLKKLKAIPDDEELTTADIRKAFSEVAAKMSKTINKKVEGKVQETIVKKQREATENAQAAVRSGTQQSADEEGFRNKVKSGDVRGSIFDFFSGKVKL